MNIQLQRTLDRFAGVPLCALFSLIERLRRRKASGPPPRKILVILLSEMGSLVLARALFEEIARRYPAASVHVLLFARNREVLDLLGVIPPENVLTLDDRSLPGFVAGTVKVLLALRKLQCDVVVDCELFARAGSIFSYLSGAPVRVGFHPHTQEGLYRGSFINRRVVYNPYRHLSQQFLTMVEAIDSASTPMAKAVSAPAPKDTPTAVFPPGEVEQLIAELHTDFPAIRDKRLVLVYPSGGLLSIRAWPLNHYRRVCAGLLSDGFAVGIIGMAADKAIGRDLTTGSASSLCIDLTGYTRSVRHLLGLFHRADLLITNDGGPGQFAALTPIHSIVLFGPETPLLYRPLSSRTHCMHLQMSCSPCLTAYNHRLSPCDGDNQCLRQITPEQVLDKAREILASRGKS